MEDGQGNSLLESFEVKIAAYTAGEERAEWSEPENGETFVFLLSGSQELYFQVEDGPCAFTMHAGQSIAWNNSIPHRWKMLEDTKVLVVRSK